jgi:radical SAM superfamily enzyme YgiQ (UPF0313 family)
MRLLLINPQNPVVNITNRGNYWNRYRVWKPLGLLVLAGNTPPGWDITIVDENVKVPDYSRMPLPDLVGVTAFTSQAPRAYEVARGFQERGVPVVMGGIHATMCTQEAAARVGVVVTGEGESVWAQVLDDARRGTLKPLYSGCREEMDHAPPARHDLLPKGYPFGAIQTTRGCPLNCNFCSVSAFNGRTYRRRPIDDVVEEFRLIREKHVLVVDDNLVGTRRDHVERAKDLFRAMIRADLKKRWICQATINMAEDEELLRLARKSGCIGVFIGFESITDEGLLEVHKKYNLSTKRDFADSVRRIQRHGIIVAGSFIMGLDVDRPGVGRRIAATARAYGVDVLNVLFLTPLPGTVLWERMQREGRVASDRFPEDWRHYTLTFPVARYRHLNGSQIVDEMTTCNREFYSLRGILGRVARNLWRRQRPVLTLVSNLASRNNSRLGQDVHREYNEGRTWSPRGRTGPLTGDNLHVLRRETS